MVSCDEERSITFYDEMLKPYPGWINQGALWSSVLAATV